MNVEQIKELLSHKFDVIDLDNLTDKVIEKYKGNIMEDSFDYYQNKAKFKVNKNKNIITINFGGEEYDIETEPYLIYINEKSSSNLLGKTYNTKILKRFFNKSIIDYNIYLNNNIVSNVDIIINSKCHDIIIKKNILIYLHLLFFKD